LIVNLNDDWLWKLLKIDIPSFEVNIFSTFMFSFSAIFLMCSTASSGFASSGNCSILNNTYSFDSFNGIYIFLSVLIFLFYFVCRERQRGRRILPKKCGWRGRFWPRTGDSPQSKLGWQVDLYIRKFYIQYTYLSENLFVYNMHLYNLNLSRHWCRMNSHSSVFSSIKTVIYFNERKLNILFLEK